MNSVPLVRKGLDILHKLLRRLLLLLLRLWGAAAARAAARRHRGPAPVAPRILLVRPDRWALSTPAAVAWPSRRSRISLVMWDNFLDGVPCQETRASTQEGRLSKWKYFGGFITYS